MMIDFAWLIPILPLIAFVIIALAPKKLLIREGAHLGSLACLQRHSSSPCS